jgi:hypothetical protein
VVMKSSNCSDFVQRYKEQMIACSLISLPLPIQSPFGLRLYWKSAHAELLCILRSMRDRTETTIEPSAAEKQKEEEKNQTCVSIFRCTSCLRDATRTTPSTRDAGNERKEKHRSISYCQSCVCLARDQVIHHVSWGWPLLPVAGHFPRQLMRCARSIISVAIVVKCDRVEFFKRINLTFTPGRGKTAI